MLIYSPVDSPRLRYTLEVLFKDLLCIKYTLTNDLLFYQQAEGPKIHYGKTRLGKEGCFLEADGLLEASGIQALTPQYLLIQDRPALFPSTTASDWPFDFWAMTFYCLSRYEEYLPFSADRYGRFPATESIAYTHGFLERPIINEWAIEFGKFLQQKWPSLQLTAPTFDCKVTYDVDMAWAYLHRPWWRLLGGGMAQLARGQWAGAKERARVSYQQTGDPFFIFPYLASIDAKYGYDTRYFWLLGDPGKHDTNADYRLAVFRDLIQSVASRTSVGIHPSFGSNQKSGQLREEINRLEAIIGQEVQRSRQHFLLLNFPETYRGLLENGIREDYSLGYADQVGFRAGLAGAFPWYDLQKEEATTLMIHPFMVMDVTLKYYLGLSPEDALVKTKTLIERSRQVGGTFTLLWHNSSFAKTMGWEGWKSVFERILDFASAEKKNF